MACLDTDVIVGFLRNSADAVSKITELNEKGETLTVSPIAACEIYKGAFRSTKENSLEYVESVLDGLTILEINRAASRLYGKYKEKMKKSPIGDFDLLIACTALAYNEKIITRNVREFEKVEGLKVEKW